jgi:uncharacterized protein with GYD domain
VGDQCVCIIRYRHRLEGDLAQVDDLSIQRGTAKHARRAETEMEAAKKAATQAGAAIREVLWTQGKYDVVMQPDDASATAMVLNRQAGQRP